MVVRQDGAGLQVGLDVFQVNRNLAAMRQKMVTDTRVTTMQRKVIINRSEAQSKENKKHKSLQFIYLVSSVRKILLHSHARTGFASFHFQFVLLSDHHVDAAHRRKVLFVSA